MLLANIVLLLVHIQCLLTLHLDLQKLLYVLYDLFDFLVHLSNWIVVWLVLQLIQPFIAKIQLLLYAWQSDIQLILFVNILDEVFTYFGNELLRHIVVDLLEYLLLLHFQHSYFLNNILSLLLQSMHLGLNVLIQTVFLITVLQLTMIDTLVILVLTVHLPIVRHEWLQIGVFDDMDILDQLFELLTLIQQLEIDEIFISIEISQHGCTLLLVY